MSEFTPPPIGTFDMGYPEGRRLEASPHPKNYIGELSDRYRSSQRIAAFSYFGVLLRSAR